MQSDAMLLDWMVEHVDLVCRYLITDIRPSESVCEASI